MRRSRQSPEPSTSPAEPWACGGESVAGRETRAPHLVSRAEGVDSNRFADLGAPKRRSEGYRGKRGKTLLRSF